MSANGLRRRWRGRICRGRRESFGRRRFFLQLYAAMLVLAALWTQLDLTAAQATTLAAMILTAHALPVELRIVQKAGAQMRAMLLLRFWRRAGVGRDSCRDLQGGRMVANARDFAFCTAAANGRMGRVGDIASEKLGADLRGHSRAGTFY